MLLGLLGRARGEEKAAPGALAAAEPSASEICTDCYGKVGVTGTLEALVHGTGVFGDNAASFETDEVYSVHNLTLRGLMDLPRDPGGNMQWNFKLRNSSRFLEEEWQVEQATGSVVKSDYVLDYWDTRPGISDYTLQGRRIRGIDLKVPLRGYQTNLVAGYEPSLSKALGVKRRVLGFRVARNRAVKGLNFAINHVANDDDKSYFPGFPVLSSRVSSMQLEGDLSRRTRLRAEVARSQPATGALAGAHLLELTMRGASWQGRFSHEDVDTGFLAPLTSASVGMTETRLSYALLISRYVTLSLAHKRRSFPGDNLRDSLISMRYTPFRWRTRFFSEFRWTPRVSVNAAGRSTIAGYNFIIGDKIGIHRINIDLLNEYRDRYSLPSQDKRQYQFTLDTALNKRVNLRSRYRRFAQQSLARERYVEFGVSYEPREWHSLELRFTNRDDRLGEGDRAETALRYGWLDVEEDREYALEYRMESFKHFTNRHLEAKVAQTF